MSRGPVPVRGWFYLAGLLLLAGLSYGALRWVENAMRAAAPAESQAPVLTVERFRAVRMNLAGLREYVLEAPRLNQLPGQRGTQIERPVLDWYQPDGETREWRLRADQGWIAADQKTMRLEGAVVMTRAADSGKAPVEVTTRDVLIRPADRYAETVAPARAVTPGGELRAVGVRAYLDRERLELLSEVRGYYAPPNR
ncbi:MAG TPA: LPS export ABC transporter periplasmic protein LptC [Candidatus Competibacteraceae bacterium]|nr:LPS export ABC transporter periplasmic protein LptC [Candidatus Competibacteraceae bacterium]